MTKRFIAAPRLVQVFLRLGLGLAAFALALGAALPSRAAGQPGWDSAIYTGSASSATTVIELDTTGYSSVVYQITNAGATNTIEFDASNDGVNWVPQNFTVLPGTSTASDVTGTGVYGATAFARYSRVQITAYGSGTVTVEGMLRGHRLP